MTAGAGGLSRLSLTLHRSEAPAAEAAIEALWETAAPDTPPAVSVFAVGPPNRAVGEAPRPDELMVLEALFTGPVPEGLADALTGLLGRPATVEFVDIPPKDWIAHSLSLLPPVQAGRFWLYGPHDRQRVPPSRYGLEIEAGAAFGTGHHPTTVGCLKALDRLAGQIRPWQALDIGCGTGVLAIAVIKLWHCPVWAGDIDAASVRITKTNAALNGAAPWLTAVPAAGIGHPRLREGGPFDLVMANILARPLKDLARDLAAVTAPRGTVILSGLLQCQKRGVLAAYRGAGLVPWIEIAHPIWPTLVLRKAPGSEE